MKKMLLAVLAVIVLAIVGAWWFVLRGPDLSQYEALVEPRITTLADQRVIEVESSGDPNAVGSEAFGLLFQAYFGTEGVPKGREQPAPRARWPAGPDVPADQWVGLYAMPVPSSVTELPDLTPGEGLSVRLTTWVYGEVAEILHKGPYDTEDATIAKLKAFLDESGYEEAGPHEEEYLRGPGMLIPVRPADYYTVIRYQVRKADG